MKYFKFILLIIRAIIRIVIYTPFYIALCLFCLLPITIVMWLIMAPEEFKKEEGLSARELFEGFAYWFGDEIKVVIEAWVGVRTQERKKECQI